MSYVCCSRAQFLPNPENRWKTEMSVCFSMAGLSELPAVGETDSCDPMICSIG